MAIEKQTRVAQIDVSPQYDEAGALSVAVSVRTDTLFLEEGSVVAAAPPHRTAFVLEAAQVTELKKLLAKWGLSI